MTHRIDDVDVAAAVGGDPDAFSRITRPLRAELHAHCFRMLGSVHDADDALQDAMLRAWRGISRFESRSSLRTWLYTITTRCCLDLASTRRNRPLPADLRPPSPIALTEDRPTTDVPWLDPYPNAPALDEASVPEARYQQREALELAFVAALQHLTANQRAALILFDVLGYSAAEIAGMMATTVASVNSALQRARAEVKERAGPQSQLQNAARLGNADLMRAARGFADALEQGNADLLISLFTRDVTWSMPPLPGWYRGLDAVRDFATRVPLTGCGVWQTMLTHASGQPAVAGYLRPDGPGPYRAWSINVLSFRGSEIYDVTSFIGEQHFQRSGLPLELSGATEPTKSTTRE